MATTQPEFIYRNRYFLLTDLILFILSAVASFALRLEMLDFSEIASGVLCFLLLSLSVKLLLFFMNGVYSHYWKNAGTSELLLIGGVCLLSGLIIFVLVLLVTAFTTPDQLTLPRSVPVIDCLLTLFLVTAARFSLRAYAHIKAFWPHHAQSIHSSIDKRALIIGAGQTGIQVLDSIGLSAGNMTAVGFLDDNESKVGTLVRGLKVLGRLADLGLIVQVRQINLVIIALPSASGSVIRQIAHACQQIGVEYQIVPGMYELLTGKVALNTLRPVSIEDLLRRTPIQLDVADIQSQLQGRCVMVTGAGGSIGSELSRQIARCAPRRLLLVGHGENSLFSIEQRLRGEFPTVQFETLLVDIQDQKSMAALFARWRPAVVFHAAAHKHVPMLETNVIAAVMNNVAGTQNVIDLCNRFDAARMVLISTDKAVQPTSIMGMSKRVAEMLIMNAAQEHPSRFAVVRFGNVLGSRGSVVPIFQQQIEFGGPITITSEQMTRFFMSVPEAVLLVLKASVLTACGPLFVLNMGEPVRILDLAYDLIKLNGLEPRRDIEIKVTGVRPGEKLYEMLFWEFEKHIPVEQGAIFALQLSEEQARLIRVDIPHKIRALIQAATDGNDVYVRNALRDIAFAVGSNASNGAVPKGTYGWKASDLDFTASSS